MNLLLFLDIVIPLIALIQSGRLQADICQGKGCASSNSEYSVVTILQVIIFILYSMFKAPARPLTPLPYITYLVEINLLFDTPSVLHSHEISVFKISFPLKISSLESRTVVLQVSGKR